MAQAVDDAIKSFRMNRTLFLLYDATKYMVAIGAVQKSLYSRLFYVTYVVFLLQN